ncbi:MAG: ComF family protein [Clostridia bacterium]|nr:ComF family protein [Clostridia bacterium]
MTFKEFIHRYVLVHKCAGCSEILEYERSGEAFCRICKLAWNTAKTENCGDCFKEISECACMPKKLSNAGALTLRRLCYYSPERAGDPQNRLIYKLKNAKNKRYASFVASQIKPALMDEIKNLVDIDTVDVSQRFLITYVPRSKKAVTNTGVDQSELICRELSAQTGIPCVRAIERIRSGKEQKKLTSAERFRNTESLFAMSENISVSGRFVILLDDVVTTGASMTACTKLLRRASAKGILCFCIATDKFRRAK